MSQQTSEHDVRCPHCGALIFPDNSLRELLGKKRDPQSEFQTSYTCIKKCFIIWGKIQGRNISRKHVTELLRKKVIGPMNFTTNSQIRYKAKLKYNEEDRKVELIIGE